MASYRTDQAGGPRVSNSTHSSVTVKETSDPGDSKYEPIWDLWIIRIGFNVVGEVPLSTPFSYLTLTKINNYV